MNCVVWEAVDPKGIRLLFIERDEYFDRTGLYGMDGRDYEDNAARFIFFQNASSKLLAENRQMQSMCMGGNLLWCPSSCATKISAS